jgi:hypothetical protein
LKLAGLHELVLWHWLQAVSLKKPAWNVGSA